MEFDRLGRELSKKDRKIEATEKDLSELRTRYEDLTKEYYKIMNQYGELGKTQKTVEKPKPKLPSKHSPYTKTMQDTSLAYSLSSRN